MTQDSKLGKTKLKGGVKPEQKGILYPDRTHSCVNFTNTCLVSQPQSLDILQRSWNTTLPGVFCSVHEYIHTATELPHKNSLQDVSSSEYIMSWGKCTCFNAILSWKNEEVAVLKVLWAHKLKLPFSLVLLIFISVCSFSFKAYNTGTANHSVFTTNSKCCSWRVS